MLLNRSSAVTTLAHTRSRLLKIAVLRVESNTSVHPAGTTFVGTDELKFDRCCDRTATSPSVTLPGQATELLVELELLTKKISIGSVETVVPMVSNVVSVSAVVTREVSTTYDVTNMVSTLV